MDNKMLLGVMCVIASIICIILAFVIKDTDDQIFYGLGVISIGLMVIAGIVISTTKGCKTGGGAENLGGGFFPWSKSSDQKIVEAYWKTIFANVKNNKAGTSHTEIVEDTIGKLIKKDLMFIEHIKLMGNNPVEDVKYMESIGVKNILPDFNKKDLKEAKTLGTDLLGHLHGRYPDIAERLVHIRQAFNKDDAQKIANTILQNYDNVLFPVQK